MNLADHAIKVASRPVVEALTKKKRKSGQKCVKGILESNKSEIVDWAGKGMPASMISTKLDISSTAFWHHAVNIFDESCIDQIKLNGGRSQLNSNYRSNIERSLS